MFMIALGKIPVVPPPEIAGTVGLHPTAASRAGKEKVVILSVQEAPFIRPEKRKLRFCPYRKRLCTVGKKKIVILSVRGSAFIRPEKRKLRFYPYRKRLLYGRKRENCDFVRTGKRLYTVGEEKSRFDPYKKRCPYGQEKRRMRQPAFYWKNRCSTRILVPMRIRIRPPASSALDL